MDYAPILTPRETNNIFHTYNIFLPSSSHLSPRNPNGQVHSNDAESIFLQEPPLKHGALAHGVPVLKYHK
jgi:hypothetical protein